MPEIPKLSTCECHNFKRKLKYIRHDYNSMHKHVSTNINSVKQNRHQTCSTNILQVDLGCHPGFYILKSSAIIYSKNYFVALPENQHFLKYPAHATFAAASHLQNYNRLHHG